MRAITLKGTDNIGSQKRCHRYSNRVNHSRRRCPAILAIYHYCKAVGHYTQCCKSNKVHEVQYDEDYPYSSDDNTTPGLLTVAEIKQNKLWRIELSINNKLMSLTYQNTPIEK